MAVTELYYVGIASRATVFNQLLKWSLRHFQSNRYHILNRDNTDLQLLLLS
jgi:hypothetical protein